MNYTSAVSIIPGGCPQFLDCRLDAKSLGRFWAYFREIPQTGESAIASARRQVELVPVPLDDTGQPGDYDYKIDANRALEAFTGRWVPVPFLRLSNEQWKDGAFKCEKGPSNWARLHVSREDSDGAYRLTFLFDTTIEEREQPTGQYFALCDDDVAENARFALSPKSRDNAWFLNTLWVDEWIAEIYDAHQTARHNGRTTWRENTPFIMEHLATYLTLLEALAASGTVPTVRVVDPAHLTPVDVDLVLDLGNSRSTGMLVETLPQRQTNLNDSYLLQIRDLSQPDRTYTGPFATRIEFAEATFGNPRLSARSGRSTPAFVWPSVVRVGPEAARLAQHSVGAEGNTGMSSPKRYLWDESPRAQQWRFNAWGTGSELEPPVTRGVFIQQINREGTPLCCFDDPGLSPRPKILRTQQPEVAFEAHFTRSSTMMFLLSEIIMHALATINSPAQRGEREQPDVPRRLKRIIFTVPSAMPIAEQRIYRRWVTWAVRMIWETLGWGQWYTTKQGMRDTRPDYRVSPEVRCSWDEATCTQLVYLYNEITEKFQGDARHFFALMGRKRGADAPSLRIANVDIGGGTIDLSITTFAVTGDEATAARIKPHMAFRDGFNIAGDDVIREIVEQHVLPCIGQATGLSDPRNLLGQLFGRDTVGGSQRNRALRTQFARQIAGPVVTRMLEGYEQADLLVGGVQERKLSAFFRPEHAPQESDHASPETEGLPEQPSAALIQYINETVERQTGKPFSLMDVGLRIDPRAIDRTIRNTLGQILANLCEVIHAYNCDLLLLTGRPSKWHAIISSFFAKLPVPADRIIPMRDFRVGSWYPFAVNRGEITDPKTTVVVGAILCALSEGHLEGFSFDTGSLFLKSTARFIGAMDAGGQIRQAQVWFEADTDNPSGGELHKAIQFSGPIPIGFRQIEAERWTTTRFYMMDFAAPAARNNARNRLPYTVKLAFTVADLADAPNAASRDEGELAVNEIEAVDGTPVNPRDLEIRLQTLPADEGYWLDTGVFNIL